MIRNNQNRRRRGGNNNGPRPQQMNGGNNYGNRLDNRQRGNASQLLEKYRALARDAQQAGDRVTAEYYLQYADHYYRVLGDYRDKQPNESRQRGREFYDDDTAGYAANGDDVDGSDEDDQDGDRSEASGDVRGDDNRNQWREDRGADRNGDRSAANAGGRNRDGNREQRSDGRNDGRNEFRGDGNRPDNRGDNRDRQNWNGNPAPRNRDDNRAERPRDENRMERPRDENRNERPRERRPEFQRAPPTEAPVVDEGPIPGLPGPATLRVRRPVAEELPLRTERPIRTIRRETAPPVTVEAVVAEAIAAAPDAEAATPRKRGRPRKIADAAPAEG